MILNFPDVNVRLFTVPYRIAYTITYRTLKVGTVLYREIGPTIPMPFEDLNAIQNDMMWEIHPQVILISNLYLFVASLDTHFIRDMGMLIINGLQVLIKSLDWKILEMSSNVVISYIRHDLEGGIFLTIYSIMQDIVYNRIYI